MFCIYVLRIEIYPTIHPSIEPNQKKKTKIKKTKTFLPFYGTDQYGWRILDGMAISKKDKCLFVCWFDYYYWKEIDLTFTIR